MKRLWPALREYRGRTELLLEIIGLRGGLWLAKRKCFPWASGAVIETRAGWRKRTSARKLLRRPGSARFQARRGCSRLRLKSIGQVARWRDPDSDDLSRVEFGAGRPEESDFCQEILIRDLFDHHVLLRGVLDNLGLANERAPGLRSDPDQHRTASSDPLRFPTVGIGVDENLLVAGDKPDRSGFTLVAVLSDGCDVQVGRLRECLSVARCHIGVGDAEHAHHCEDRDRKGTNPSQHRKTSPQESSKAPNYAGDEASQATIRFDRF